MPTPIPNAGSNDINFNLLTQQFTLNELAFLDDIESDAGREVCFAEIYYI